MKKLSLLAVLLFASTSALACGGADKAQKLADRLGLDATQTEQVMTILKEQRAKKYETHMTLREQGVERGSEEARAQREALRSETEARLSNVLTAEQLAEFERMRDEKRQKMRQKRQSDREGAAI